MATRTADTPNVEPFSGTELPPDKPDDYGVSQLVGRGGEFLVHIGEVDRSTFKVDDKTGEVKGSLTVIYFGGNKYLRLANAEQARHIKEGDTVRVISKTREFDGKISPHLGIVEQVNGQSYDEYTSTLKKGG